MLFDRAGALPKLRALYEGHGFDPISPKGIAYFSSGLVSKSPCCQSGCPKRNRSRWSATEAMVVRSETKVTRAVMEAAPRLRVVGRAGVGGTTSMWKRRLSSDRRDEHARREHHLDGRADLSMLMALARKSPQAHMSMKTGEWNRKAFQGVELYNKTLGILGMGRIGSEVARRAIAFGMRVLAYDPYLALSRAKALQVEMVELDELYGRSDFITTHMPMTEETKGMINAAAFAKMKKGVRVLNCARGGIINEADLLAAVQTGHVRARRWMSMASSRRPPISRSRNLPL